MRNNDILRRLRYVFDFSDSKMITLFKEGGQEVVRADISSLLKKDDDSDFVVCTDLVLATFLNGFINYKRGKKEGVEQVAEAYLPNNLILRKLKIALDYKNEDLLGILSLSAVSLSKHELSAFFRKKGHKNYRQCKDQVLRKFLMGLQIKFRGEPTTDTPSVWK
ncbi:MAG: hypothetical protein COA36_04625 [Desulfotalea sp.]|nr:MAG: hypothetical protein COA36_04625 [Desulfotalea sp.]